MISTLYGLHISPDLDTVMYTLAEVANPATGWGLAGDTWAMLDMLSCYGEEPWFRLGDRDLATHLLRTQWLAQGMTLTAVTERLARGLGVQHRLLPVTDDPLATMVDTVEYWPAGVSGIFRAAPVAADRQAACGSKGRSGHASTACRLKRLCKKRV